MTTMYAGHALVSGNADLDAAAAAALAETAARAAADAALQAQITAIGVGGGYGMVSIRPVKAGQSWDAGVKPWHKLGLVLGGPLSGATAPGPKVLELLPFVLAADAQLTELAQQNTSNNGFTYVRMGVWAADQTTLAPIGAPLADSGKILDAGANSQKSAVLGGGGVALTKQTLYWGGFVFDNGGAGNTTWMSGSYQEMLFLLGIANGALNPGVSDARASGLKVAAVDPNNALPNLTAAAFARLDQQNVHPIFARFA